MLEFRDKVPPEQRIDAGYLSDHDTRSGELISGSVASGATADELDRDLRPSVQRLLALLLQNHLSDPRQAAKESGQREPHLGFMAASIWLTAGYDWASNTPAVTIPAGLGSGFGLDLGGDLFFRIAGPVYLGGLVDYGLFGPNALLVAGGARLAIADVALSGGFGYTSVSEGGLGALLAGDFGLTRGFALRVQGSWRRSSFTTASVPPADYRITVWSLMGGLSLQF